jgi:GDP-4-dehydro-6-deoxy-D-mannose reductase
MRALVTGAGGFVGQYLVQHLQACGDEVLGTYVEDTLPAPLWPRTCRMERLDVCEVKDCVELLGKFQPEAVYHLGGIAFVPELENDLERALLVNVAGVNNIFRAAHLLEQPTKILLVSSAEVYGRIRPDQLPLTEASPINPTNNYSLSKAMAELVAKRYEQIGKVTALIMRPFNHTGAGQNNRFVASSFAYQLSQIAKGKLEAVMRVGNLDVRRDFSDVRDIVRGYRLAVEKGRGSYILGSGRAITIRSILDRLIQASGVKVKIETDPTRVRSMEIPEVYGDYRKAREELGWQPQYDFNQTLDEMYKYWAER